MRLLVVSPSLPYEGVPHAGGQFLLQHLTSLSDVADVHLVVPATPENLEGRDRVPPQLQVTMVPMPAPGSRVQVWWDDRTRGPRPPAGMRRAMLPVVQAAARAADIVELQWVQSAWFGSRLGVDVPRVVYAYDVWTQSEQRRLQLADDWFSAGERFLLRTAHRRRERSQLESTQAVFVFSDKDARLVRELGARSAVHLVQPWLDRPVPTDVVRDRQLVLFTGALFRHENADACRWLLHDIWPRVRARVPAARLVLAGDNPPQDVYRAAAATAGVTVTGWVDDLNDCYKRASVYVAPLRLGAGLKFKVPQAMLHGLPVVSTPIGAEGIVEEAPPEAFAAVTSSAAAFADAVIGCLTDPATAHATGRAAQQWADERYEFSRGTAIVRDVYARLVAHSA